MRSEQGGPPDAVLVLRTLGAPERRRFRGRRGREVEQAEPEPVATARATVVRPEPFPSRDEAEAWLAKLRDDRDAARDALDAAVRRLNGALHAHRIAAADPYVREVSADHSLVVRIGFGSGDHVADGRFASAWELPRESRGRRRRSVEAPEERFAAILGGRELPLACEELVLRARADLLAGRSREAALEARVALEALLAELEPRDDLGADRKLVGDAANAALRGGLSPELRRGLEEAVGRMETALRRHRVSG